MKWFAKGFLAGNKNNRSSTTRSGSTIYTGRSKNVPVTYVDDVPDHENPENFTRKMAYCYECGEKVNHLAQFCTFCGTSLLTH